MFMFCLVGLFTARVGAPQWRDVVAGVCKQAVNIVTLEQYSLPGPVAVEHTPDEIEVLALYIFQRRNREVALWPVYNFVRYDAARGFFQHAFAVRGELETCGYARSQFDQFVIRRARSMPCLAPGMSKWCSTKARL